jgi:hypothetical protein
MAVVDDFKGRFPEFDPATVDQYIPILEPVWLCYWGGRYDEPCGQEIVLNLLAHLITVEISAGSGNVKTALSKSVGNVSVSYSPGYAPTSERNAWLKTTKYGARYLWLTSRNAGGFFV